MATATLPPDKSPPAAVAGAPALADSLQRLAAYLKPRSASYASRLIAVYADVEAMTPMADAENAFRADLQLVLDTVARATGAS